MKLIHFIGCVFLIVAVGCTKIPHNEAQTAFIRSLSTEKEKYADLVAVQIKGKGDDGRLLPEDFDEQVNDQKKKVERILYEPPVAANWTATIIDIRRLDELILVTTEDNGIRYSLRIVEPQAKRLAENFRVEAQVIFSGKLMPEGSKYFGGAFLLSNFGVYPTSIKNASIELLQTVPITDAGRLNEMKSIRRANSING